MDTAKVQQVRTWAWLTLGACGVALVGLFLPWTTGTGTYRDATLGADSPAVLVVALLITAAALIPVIAPHGRWAVALPGLACGLGSLALVIFGGVTIWLVENDQSFDGLAVGAGAYISLFAGAVIFVSSMVMARASKRLHKRPTSQRVSRSTASSTRVAS